MSAAGEECSFWMHTDDYIGCAIANADFVSIDINDDDNQTVCENILHGFLYVFDLAFVILKGIYSFKSPKRFLEISSRDLTSSSLFCQP
jgi:hypothetical protein